jgi:spore germination protein KC
MAVFKADKMIGEMSEQESRGLLFALDRAGYGLTPVTYKDQDVTLEISSTSSCLRPKTDGQEIVFELSVKMKSTIMEQSGTEPLRVEDLDALEALQRAAIQKEIDLALEAAKRLGADVFDFGGLLNKYCPDEWKSMEDNWEALFQRAEFRVAIDNQIYDIGTVSKPLAPEEMK